MIEEGTYFHQPCKAAGECLGVSLEEGRSYLRLQLTGTLCEGLLKHYTGNPKGEVRGHICPSTCNGEEAADNLVHVRKVRKRQSAEQEGAWVENLMKAVPAREGEDELAALEETDASPRTSKERWRGIRRSASAGGEREARPRERREGRFKEEQRKKRKRKRRREKSRRRTAKKGRETRLSWMEPNPRGLVSRRRRLCSWVLG